MRPITTAVAACAACTTLAAPADPPPGYYDAVVGPGGPAIKAQLTTLLNAAVNNGYDAARLLLQDTDEDPALPANIILTYNGASIPSPWTSGVTWNREHTWPVSLGVGESGADYADLHMLRPCDPGVNGSRGNKQFGTAPGQWDPDLFGVPFRGEMARTVFYANTRYTYLNIPIIGSQAQFVDWHIQQMPDDDDRRRNDRVFTHQQNRNPFVDHPEWVWAVFGGAPSDAQLAIDGLASADGASATLVDLGTFISGATLEPVIIDIDKTGAAPVTYLVSATGDAVTTADTGFQAGLARGPQSAAIPVSIAGGPGPLAGTITIDNTDVTSAALGQGDADADDTIMVIAAALAPAVASLDPAATVTQAVIDLGTVTVGRPADPTSVQVWNITTPGFAAALDIDAVILSGDTAGLIITGVPAPGLPAGDAAAIGIELTPQESGPIAALVTLLVSDEDLPGAAVSSIEVSIIAHAVADCPADVNADGAVTPADFSAWIAAFNAQTPACDQNADGLCTPADFSAWIANFNVGCI
jgi:endonuclease I